jgi:hypothetical protein
MEGLKDLRRAIFDLHPKVYPPILETPVCYKKDKKRSKKIENPPSQIRYDL